MAYAGRGRLGRVADTLVLCYHAVSDSWPAPLAVSTDQLRTQLERLVARGYRGVTFSEAVGEEADHRRLAVTFDDAYRSTLLALPILAELDLSATVFVPTAHVGSPVPMGWAGIDHWIGGPHERELMCMDVAELRSLVEAGWEIGAHTHSHPRLTALADDDLARELSEPRELLERWLGKPCSSLAYPYGGFDPRVVEAARAAGYAAACTLDVARHGGDPLISPRVGVYRDEQDWRVALKCARLTRRVSLAKLRHPLQTLRG
jgi:peptidoglycan/xylan/chitin deacetylase (PgdA/CDA1 family)